MARHSWRPGLEGLLPLVLAAAVAATAGCSQAPAPETPPPTETAETAEAEVPEAEAADPADTDPEADAAEAEPDPTVIVIERRKGERKREAEPRTLYEAALAAREDRAKAGPSRISVTDDNLHEFQGEGLTFTEEKTEDGGAGAEAGDDGGEEPGDAAGSPSRGEAYWRSRVGGVRLSLREAVDALAELEERAASLRRSFYAQDDPYVRDAEIKPAWDRALDRIADTREAIFRLREELDAALEEGRRAGALPGWLREGIALEPRPDELPEPREDGAHEPGEPEVMEIGEEPPAPGLGASLAPLEGGRGIEGEGGDPT